MPLILFYIVGFGILSRRPVLDDFIEGAKKGMGTVAGILPTLVGLMVSVGILRASGFLDFLGGVLAMPAALIHLPPQIVPVVLVRLVSNSAATAGAGYFQGIRHRFLSGPGGFHPHEQH